MNKPIYIICIAVLSLFGCGGSEENASAPNLTPLNQSPPSGSASATNSTGQIVSPTGQSTFASNPFFIVRVQNDNGIASINLRFSQDGSVYTLCDSRERCGDTVFETTVSNVNPGDYGAQSGSVSVDVIVTDTAQQTDVVDSWQFDWLPPTINDISASRDAAGTSITVSWTENPALLRYNVYVAAQSGVNQQTYLNLPEGQALLAVSESPQVFTALSATTNYYVLVTGVDGSGESTAEPEVVVTALGTAPNRPPIANDDIASVNEDDTIEVDALVNDTDPDGDTLSLVSVNATVGNASIQNDLIVFAPPPNFNGNTVLDYSISDGNGGMANAQITVSVIPVNDPPVAVDDTISVDEDESVQIDALLNDSDVDGDPLSLVNVNTPLGNAAIQGDFIEFEPPPNFNGSVTLDYEISDGNGANDSAQITVTVLPVNDPPVANDDFAQTPQTTSINIDVLNNDTDVDGDVLTVISTSGGQGAVVIESDNTLTYTPGQAPVGIDTFDYTISDPSGETSTATVSVDVGLVSRAPIANNDDYTSLIDQLLTVTAAQGLMVNDSDPDGDTISIVTAPVVAPLFGTLSLAADGSFTYQPNSGFVGLDEFVYQLQADNGQVQNALVSLEIQAIPEPLQGDSNSITGDFSYFGLGETSQGSGIGTGLYRIGECLQGPDTICTMRGEYTERQSSGNAPGQTGRYAFIQSYGGTGSSPVIAQSVSAGSNFLTFTDIGDAVFELYLFPDSGGVLASKFPDEPFEDSIGFGAFISTTAFCSGLPQGVPCSIGEIGLFPGSDILAPLDRLEFEQRGEALVKSDNAAPQATDESYSTALNTPLTVSAPGLLQNATDPDIAMRGDSLQVIRQFFPGIGPLAALAYDEYRQYVYTTGFFSSSVIVNNRLGSQITSFQSLGEPTGSVDMEITPEAMQLAGNPIPQGSLLFINGETGPAEIYAINPDTGVLLGQLNTAVGDNDVIGGAYNPQTQTLFLLQQTQSGTGDPIISEVDPLSGAILTQIVAPFTALDFDVADGDLDVNNITGSLYVLGSDEASLMELNQDGSLVRLLNIPSNIVQPSGLAINQNGDRIWISADNGDAYELKFANDGSLPELQTEIVVTTENGTLIVERDGSFVYTPEQGFVGDDIFTYQVVDKKGKVSLANVRISVTN